MDGATDEVSDPASFEVSTGSADALRARLTVVGDLTSETVPLLASSIDAHLSAGRRYLRVDVVAARTADLHVLDSLTELHDRTTRLGGMLVFETAAASSADSPNALARHVIGLRSRGTG